MNTLKALWSKIPAPARSVINVCAGAAVAALVTYLTGVVSGNTFDLSLAWQAVLTAIATAFVRAVNPLDGAYGVGKPSTDNVAPTPSLDVTDAPAADVPQDSGDPVEPDVTGGAA